MLCMVNARLGSEQVGLGYLTLDRSTTSGGEHRADWLLSWEWAWLVLLMHLMNPVSVCIPLTNFEGVGGLERQG